MEQKKFAEFMDQISNAFKSKKFDQSLKLSQLFKLELLKTPPVDPVFLGWQRFYEFLNLVEKKSDKEALSLFISAEKHPYSMRFDQIAYMTSVSAELACRLKDVELTLKLARNSWAFSFKEKDMLVRVQNAQNACIYFERLKQNRLNFSFARFLTGTGKSNDIPVLFIQGLECLMANYIQSKSRTVASILHDSLEDLSRYIDNPPEGMERNRIVELLEGIASIELEFEPSELIEKGSEYVTNNRLPELIQLVTAYPDLVREIDSQGFNLLLRAVQANNLSAAEFLIQHGSDIHHFEPSQNTFPLLMAVNLGHVDILKLLLKNGADPEIKGLLGHTPLIRSVIENHFEVFLLLMESGVLVDRIDNSGNTALLHAVEDQKIEMVRSLIFAGSDPKARNAAGQSIKDIAKIGGNSELIEFLAPIEV